MESPLLKIEKLLLKKPRHFDHMKIASVTFPFSREKDKKQRAEMEQITDHLRVVSFRVVFSLVNQV